MKASKFLVMFCIVICSYVFLSSNNFYYFVIIICFVHNVNISTFIRRWDDNIIFRQYCHNDIILIIFYMELHLEDCLKTTISLHHLIKVEECCHYVLCSFFSMKVNVFAQLEFELTYYDVSVQYVSCYTTETPFLKRRQYTP